MVINYLNTKYSFSNRIDFRPREIAFDKLIIYDTLGNQANITGSLEHRNFSQSRFDVKIITDQLLFLDTDRYMNELYYGTAITSGDISINGSPRDIKLDINVASKRGTHIYLPLNYSVEISDKDYIVFVSENSDTLIEPPPKATSLFMRPNRDIDHSPPY